MLSQGKAGEVGMMQRYADAVSYIETLSNALIYKDSAPDSWRPSILLEKMQYFLDLIGNPEKGLKFVHVTGTGGKGTVSSMIHSMLVADSKKAGLFTSPYATTAIEEIQVGNTYISPDDFARIVESLKPYVEKASQNTRHGRPSAFGLFFAAALVYFKEQGCEWAVIEVGIGGRFDFTNIIQDPVVTVVTHIDYDHTDILGKTLREIALDKVGIIKKGSLFFTAEQRSSVIRLFKDTCRKQGATFHKLIPSEISRDTNKLLAQTIGISLGIADSCIKKGIEGSRMPCRFEIMQEKPLVVLDGAHNRLKMRNTVHRLQSLHYKKLFLIIAISNMEKDNTAIFKEIVPYADSVILTSFNSSKRKSIHPSAIVPYAKRWLKKSSTIQIVQEPGKAFAIATKQVSVDDCILVSGSFFLAGELRKKWVSEEWILRHRKSFK